MDKGLEIVATADLKIGMFVSEPDRPWLELPFPLQGFLLSSPREIELFQQHCRFVYVDRSFSIGEHYRATPRPPDRPLRSQALPGAGRVIEDDSPEKRARRKFLHFLYAQESNPETAELARGLAQAEPRFDALQQALCKTLDSVKVEEKVDFRELSSHIKDLAGSLERHPDAVMWLLRLKSLDDYSFDQSMDVSVYLLLIGKHVGLSGAKLHELSLAGLLQDVGKTCLPPSLLTKAEPLTAEERQLVNSHVASSLELLCQQPGLSQELRMIVANHHERWDGSGYPRGLKLQQIGRGAEMAGLVDSFCAMLKSKPYRAALGHQAALEQLFNLRDKQFSPALMEQFVQCIGLYPIGTLVELNTGEVCIVIQQNRVRRARPCTLVVLDSDKEKVRGYEMIDLRDPRFAKISIVRALPQDAYGLVAQDFYLG